MKKTVSLALVLLFLFSMVILTACKSKTVTPAAAETPAAETPAAVGTPAAAPETTADAQPDLAASKPNEYVAEKLAAGMEVMVAFNPNNLDGINGAQDTRFQEELPAMGFTYIMEPWNGDTSKQITQIENWVTMGAAAICVSTADPELIKDVCAKAEKAGTSMILYGTIPNYFCSAYTSLNLDWMGYSSALIARAWLDQNKPDSRDGDIKVAAYGSFVVTDTKTLSMALRRGIEDDPRCKIVYTSDECLGIDKGFTATEEALTANPDISIVASFDLYAAFGASNYLSAQPGVDLDNYCVVGTTTNQNVEGFIEQTKSGEGCFRGTTRGESDPIAGMMKCINEMLLGGAEKPYTYFSKLSTLTAFDFDYAGYFDRYYSED